MLRFIKAGFVVLLLCAPTMAHGACWAWSRTTSANANADPTINWSVGMSPSSVDASGRAMMARTAECRDDYSGLLVQGGTASAYTLTTYQTLASTPNDGQLLGFTVTNTNTAGVTLTVDGGSALPIQTAAGTAVGAGVLVAGSPYTVKYSSSATAWILRDFYGSPFSIPVGGLIPYTGTTSPNANFVLPYGQCISRTTYATYFALVSTTFGVCDGTTTFGVPDLRGRAVAGIDNMGGSAASRLTATYFGSSGNTLGNTGGGESQTLTQAQLPNYSLTVTDPGHVHAGNFVATSGTGTGNVTYSTAAAGGSFGALIFGGSAQGLQTPSATTGITVASGGSGNPHPIVQPTMVLSYILRIL